MDTGLAIFLVGSIWAILWVNNEKEKREKK